MLCFRGDVQTDDLEKLTERSESQILLGLPGKKLSRKLFLKQNHLKPMLQVVDLRLQTISLEMLLEFYGFL